MVKQISNTTSILIIVVATGLIVGMIFAVYDFAKERHHEQVIEQIPSTEGVRSIHAPVTHRAATSTATSSVEN